VQLVLRWNDIGAGIGHSEQAGSVCEGVSSVPVTHTPQPWEVEGGPSNWKSGGGAAAPAVPVSPGCKLYE